MSKLDSLIGTPPFVKIPGRKYPFHLFDFECDDGWYDILVELGPKLIAIDPTIYVDQVKEKFGGLRVYLGDMELSKEKWDEAQREISAAADKSWKTCEVCSKPGSRRAGGWIKVLCDECHGKED